MANGGEYDDEGVGDDDDGTMTVTIALDAPQQPLLALLANQRCSGDDEEQDADFLAIPGPPCHNELLAKWKNAQQQKQKKAPGEAPPLLVQHLPTEHAQMLALRLNSPACGSMRNWEFLAADLGLSTEEIVALRRNENPTGKLLRRFGHEPLLKMLELIGQAGRVDVLLAMLSAASSYPLSPRAIPAAAAAAIPPSMPPLDDSALATTSTANFISSSSMASKSPPREPFLLVLHHEHANNRDLRRLHRMLLKNLDRYAQAEGIKVLDVDHCIAENDLFGSVRTHFERAWQILMALSPDFAEAIAEVAVPLDSGNGQQQQANKQADPQQADQRTLMKRHLHQMTFQEVLYNHGENRRFRVLLMQGTRREHVPRGWPSNTLHYRFPEDFSSLCERLFDKSSSNRTADS